jgi:DNA-binding winged helix-turn-helix (wHTH) protein
VRSSIQHTGYTLNLRGRPFGGRLVHLRPQPFKLLCLLTSQTGKLLTREEIRAALWKDDTFVDFEQGVDFAIKQVREALSDQAEHPVYIQTIPKRGYKFLVPVSAVSAGVEEHQQATVDSNLDKALWANIAELRLAEERSNRRQKILASSLAVLALASCWYCSPGRAGDWSRR